MFFVWCTLDGEESSWQSPTEIAAVTRIQAMLMQRFSYLGDQEIRTGMVSNAFVTTEAFRLLRRHVRAREAREVKLDWSITPIH